MVQQLNCLLLDSFRDHLTVVALGESFKVHTAVPFRFLKIQTDSLDFLEFYLKIENLMNRFSMILKRVLVPSLENILRVTLHKFPGLSTLMSRS